MKIESTGASDCKRVVGEKGEILAMLVQYANDQWAVHDAATDRAICAPIHPTPTKAMRWFEATTK